MDSYRNFTTKPSINVTTITQGFKQLVEAFCVFCQDGKTAPFEGMTGNPTGPDMVATVHQQNNCFPVEKQVNAVAVQSGCPDLYRTGDPDLEIACRNLILY